MMNCMFSYDELHEVCVWGTQGEPQPRYYSFPSSSQMEGEDGAKLALFCTQGVGSTQMCVKKKGNIPQTGM